MKTIKTETTKYVETKVEIEKYVTEDGTEFDNKEDALKHENYLSFKRVKHNNYFAIDGEWMFFENEERLHSIVWDDTNFEDGRFSDIDFPVWLLVREESDPYYSHSYQYLHKLDEVKTILEDALSVVNSLNA